MSARSTFGRLTATMLAVPAVLSANSAIAADDGVEEVVIVATRVAVAPEKVGNAVSVINEEAIRNSQTIIASDLLATVPSVGVTRNGGPGTLTSVRIRGAEGDHTLVLIDGVQINDPSSTGGGFDFGNLMIGDTSRIEVLRGPQSTLYGSQAIGGVINIVTVQPGDDLGGSLQGEYGSMSSSQIKGSVGGKFDRLTARVAGSYYHTDSVSTFAGGAEDDGFRNTTFSGRLGYAFTDAVSLDLRAYYADGKVNTDGYPPPFYVFADSGDYTKSSQLIGYAGLNFALLDGRLQNRLAFQRTDSDRDVFSGPIGSVLPTGKYKGENSRYEYQGTWKFSDRVTAVFGLQREESGMSSDLAPQRADVKLDSAYLQLQAEIIDGLTLTAGDRYDDHETFGSEHSPQVAAAWKLPTNTILRASWGEGFKAPTLYQLYSDYRNPFLQPETAKSWDMGVEQRFLDERASVSVTYFDRDTHNQINYLSCTFPLNAICSLPGHSSWGYYLNTVRTTADGLELQASVRIPGGLDFSANYTHMTATDRSPGSPTEGLRLLRRPDAFGNVTLGYNWPAGLYSAVAVRYTSSSVDVDDMGARTTLGAYTLVDLRASWSVNKSLDVAARVENLFDEKYQSIYEFGAPGRAGYVSLTYHF
ncbi:MAG: TonB-dependent receptor [Steroidobacteraceae bacterium]